ncbi:hypothetical protein ABT095_30645 [Kitasatospora sp. NPDC002227]|uniref:hypothetical protein n=1 Tax=Kitasatospora sp. NPDC002227 TaxID=3154773 RepID=UPI00332D025C
MGVGRDRLAEQTVGMGFGGGPGGEGLDPVASPSGKAGPDSTFCHYDEWYSSVSNQGKTMQAVGATQADYNGTGSDATSTFSAQVSGTVTASISSSLSADANTVVADASMTMGASLSVSLTASLGNSTTVTAKPGQTAYAIYGVWRLRTYGTYNIQREDCSTSSAALTAWSPWYVGWQTWTS